MDTFTRRDFLKIGLGCLSLPILTGFTQQPSPALTTVLLPLISELDDPLLIRIVDCEHPISQEDIKILIEPKLVPIKMSMDGILAANENVRVNQICLPDLKALFTVSDQARTGLYIHSGFRSFEEQSYAYSHARDKSAVLMPGISQHHTGLAVDFTSSEIGKVIDVDAGFERTKAGKWIVEHGWEYGFVQSYISSHDDIRNESWHFLFIGKPLAKAYHDLKATNWYGDVFILQMAMNLGMNRIVFDQKP